ncbi:hypothetical protein KJ951_00830 [Patescibacteria group bacterium]|nr:hypothetical protein [Patescibacteria group bacterium]MBU1702924.1 hypothetical protein [Patescibacteria group bacterium]MBU1953486.1 hypothetical protein [Patescibacteria group bacterium]
MEDTQNENTQNQEEKQSMPESTEILGAGATPPEVPQPESSKPMEVKMPEILKAAKEQPKTTSEEKIWALLSYIPFVALVSLVMKPESNYVKLHGRQGLLLFMIFFGSIFVYLVPFIGPVVGIIIHFAAIIIGIFSMYQAFIGNWWKIPVLGDIAEIIPVEGLTKVARGAMMGEKVDEEKRKMEMEEEAKVKTENLEQPEQEIKTEEQGNIETQVSDETPEQKNS